MLPVNEKVVLEVQMLKRIKYKKEDIVKRKEFENEKIQKRYDNRCFGSYFL